MRATGYDEFSLSSLNTGEYGAIHPVMFDLMDRFEPENVSISLSSMHASTITPELSKQVRRVRKSGFTIAPEAGTQRMRNVINKNLDEEQILTACRLAFEAGWDHVKLYFMIGLPTETDADVDGLVDLAHKIADIGKQVRGKTRRPYVTLSASSFIPKPETPFQWVGMDRIENLYRKQERIAGRVRRGVRFKHHECETSYLEGVFSRGDRALGNVLELAWRNGARFDGWGEHFNLSAWRKAFEEQGIDPDFYAYTDFDPQGRLPWHVVHSRVNRKWLAIELKRALAEATLSVCGPKDCHGCAPFARDCVKGVVAETTGRPLDSDLPILSTPAAPGPGRPTALAPHAPVEGSIPEIDDRPRYRYRARFEKRGRLRFLGHLDLVRMLLRALRRAGVDLVYSRGFNPKPKVSFGPALSVGLTSEGEYMDFESWERIDAEELRQRVQSMLPSGLAFVTVRALRRDTPKLGDTIRAARYRVNRIDPVKLQRGVERWRTPVPMTVERAGKNGKVKKFDLKRELETVETGDDGSMRFTLAIHHDGASVRPGEALNGLLGEALEGLSVVREDLLVEWNGRRVNPILAAAASDGQRTLV